MASVVVARGFVVEPFAVAEPSFVVASFACYFVEQSIATAEIIVVQPS